MGKTMEGYSFEGIPSYEDIVWVKSLLVRCNELKSNEFRLLLVILGLKGAEQIYISQELMAERMGGCSIKKVQRTLESLCELKLITKQERRITTGKHKGRYTTNIYTLANIKSWLQERVVYRDSNTSLYKPFVWSPLISDNELRLFAVIKSLDGYDDILLSIASLVKYTGLDKKTLLNIRKSLLTKGLINYERRRDVLAGNTMSQYFWNEEKEWLESQFEKIE